MSFYIFFFVANRIGSETSQKLPNESPIQKLFQLACDLFILMDSAIICIYFRNTQLAISFKMNAASLIRNMLAIILRNLLKQYLTFSSNTFQGPFNTHLAAAKAFFFYIKHLHARVNIKFTIISHISTMICLGIKENNSKKLKL